MRTSMFTPDSSAPIVLAVLSAETFGWASSAAAAHAASGTSTSVQWQVGESGVRGPLISNIDCGSTQKVRLVLW